MRKKQTDMWMVTLYVITMAVAYAPRYGDYKVSSRVQLFIAMAWAALALLKLAANGFRFKHGETSAGGFFLKMYLTPQIAVHLYTVLLMVFGVVEWKYLRTNATSYVPTLLATLSIYLFGVKALRYNCAAIVLAWFASVTGSVILEGPGIIWDAIYQAYFNLTAGVRNYLELHDMVLAIGYLICFYCISNEKWTTRNLWFCFMAVTIMALGMKRISVAGIAVVILFHLVLRLCGEKMRYQVCRVCGVAGIILCYGFVFLMASGDWFFNFAAEHGINLMGRNYYFKDIMKYAEFSITFPGIGRSVVAQLLQGELSYLRVGGIHSDILKMYVENGFIVFGLWLWYYLIQIPKMYQKRFGYKPAVLYFTLIIYTFILYLTDNTENYFTCQIFSILLPAYYAMSIREKEEKRSLTQTMRLHKEKQ